MNKNTAVTVIVIVLVVVGGIVLLTKNTANQSGTATTETSTDQNNSGQTGASPSQPQASQAGVPIVVTNSNAIPTDTTVVFKGTVNPNGAFTNYWYEYGTTSSLGNKSGVQLLGSGFFNFNAPTYVTGLSKNTTYYFRLVAENQYGKNVGSQYSFKTTSGVSSPVGSAPLAKTLVASGVSLNTVNLNGEVTPNGATTEYWFEYGKTPNLGKITASASVGKGSSKMSVSSSLSDLDSQTAYYFRINAQNQFGTVNGSIQNFKTSGPETSREPSVSTGKATAINESSATLNGSVNPNGRETKYWFEYSTDSLLGSLLLKSTNEIGIGNGVNNVEAKVDISGLNSKVTYYFRLVAQNSLGTVRGDLVSFKTK